MNAHVHSPLPDTDAPHRIELHIDSRPAQIASVRRTLEEFAGTVGFDSTTQAQLGLCVNEALANVIRHAYGGVAGKPIVIVAEYDVQATPSPALRVTMRDWGNGVNPAACTPRPRDPLTPGGVGLICLRSLLDEVTYSPQPDGMLLTMVKKK